MIARAAWRCTLAACDRLTSTSCCWCARIGRTQYDRLHLHDIIDECHLPFFPMPDTFPTFPTRVQFGNYLQAYQIALGSPSAELL